MNIEIYGPDEEQAVAALATLLILGLIACFLAGFREAEWEQRKKEGGRNE